MFAHLPHDLRRVRLRTLRSSDLDLFHGYRSDPVVARFQGWTPMSREQASAFLREQSVDDVPVPGSWRQLAIAEVGTDALLGDVGVWVSADGTRAEFGLSIAPVAQGHGYGTECVRGLLALLFSSTPVEEVEASADVRNQPCLAMLARSGMRVIHTRTAEYKGEMCMERVYSLCRSAHQGLSD
ncbi:MAG TPA: GNAT family N-acetyltransferase [Oleiagrimonas sp.]|nr:GNAT family N-acetyltransferase [Oleiagrimonas sp.]